MSLKKKAIHGAKWTLLQEVFSQLLDFSIILILARLLDPKDFGIIAISTVIISAMTPLISQGLAVAITQRDELEEEHLNTAFWITFIMGCIFSIFIVISAEWWAIIFSEPALSQVLIWFSLSIILFSLSTIQQAILRRELNFKVYAIRTIIGKSIGGLVGVTFALYGFGIWSLVSRFLVTSFINVLLLWKISNWRPKLQFSKKHFRDLYPFGMQIMMNELLVFVNRRSDSLLISYFLGSTALGYYNIAYRLMSVVFTFVSKTISQVGMPTFSRLQNDKERLCKAFYDITQLIALVVFPIFLGISVLVPEIVISLLGEKWSQSIPVLQILLLIGIVHCLLTPMASLIVGVGKPGRRLKLQLVDSTANLIGFIIAIQWGIIGVAASYVIVGYTLFPLWYLTIKKILKIHFFTYIRLIIRPFIVSSIMVLSIIYAKSTIIDRFEIIEFIAFAITSGILIYFSLVYLFYPTVINKVFNILKVLFFRKKLTTS